ncbi:MAG TPA: hypothetical protein VF280_10945 [Burkholderiales bacterium]|jgi:uncharacterized protein YuzE
MRLADIAPELVSELTTGLVAQGRLDLAKQLEAVEILRCNYDEFADAGTIYLVRPRPSWYYEKLSAPVKETIGIGDSDLPLNVDVDHDGHLFGIEFIGRADIVAALQPYLTRGRS